MRMRLRHSRRRRLLLLGSLLCFGFVAGCSDAVGGTPSPAGQAAESPRPREVRLDGVDPCSLLTSEQRKQLGIDRPPIPGKSDVDGSPYCGYRNSAEESGYLVALVTTQGLAEYVATGEGQIPTRQLEIAGFPAVELRPSPDEAGNLFCLIGVDVADGQFLSANFSQVAPSGPPLSQETLCAKAVEHTAAAMKTLLNQR